MTYDICICKLHIYMVNMSFRCGCGEKLIFEINLREENQNKQKHELKKPRVEDGSNTAVAAMWKNWMIMGSYEEDDIERDKRENPKIEIISDEEDDIAWHKKGIPQDWNHNGWDEEDDIEGDKREYPKIEIISDQKRQRIEW